MKYSKYLSILVSVVVLSAWSFKLNQPSVFRGGNAMSMSEEFSAYGLNDSIMVVVGIVKILLALLLLAGGLKFTALLKPSAAIMSLFMIGAVYFHISISDGILPTLPSATMLLCCLLIVFSPKFVREKKSWIQPINFFIFSNRYCFNKLRLWPFLICFYGFLLFHFCFTELIASPVIL